MKRFAILAVLAFAVCGQVFAGIPEQDYIIRAQPDFTPTKVSDDGTFTYIEMAKNYAGQMPTVIRLNAEGTATDGVMNYAIDEQGRLKVHGVMRHFKLVLSDYRSEALGRRKSVYRCSFRSALTGPEK